MAEQDRVSSIADASKPNAGRIYDFMLGGNHNFEVDRLAAQQVLKALPDFPHMARMVRWFLGEAVRLLAAEGITQFIDFASGLPTVDHIHQIAPAGTKVIYSDIDPVTVAYGQEIIKDLPNARYVVCEAGKPETLLDSPIVSEFFGKSRKVGIGFNGIAYFLKDEQISHAMNTLHAWAENGSRLFLCDFDITNMPAEFESSLQLYKRMGQPIIFRTLKQLQSLVAPWQLGKGFRHPAEWLGISKKAAEEKKSPFMEVLKAAILEK
ncbi:MAG: hypothetical protein A2177_06945 [Spirochaetes bacterium RBG_13_68_11]|nr:MAG: hypothetical protein A2177_06945 [Spirochaetes bacterium RBG_13_68_11]